MWPPRATGRKPQLGPSEPLDDEAFLPCNRPCHCPAASEKHTAVLNAANEQAVHAFLEDCLPYRHRDTVKAVLDQMDAELRGNPPFTDVEEMNQLELEAADADDLINNDEYLEYGKSHRKSRSAKPVIRST